MRKMLAAAMVLAVTSANAEELRFGDLNYFIKTGELNVAADVSSVFSKYSNLPNAGDEIEARGILVETKFGYGISDRLNVYLGLDYAYDYEFEDKTDNNPDPNADEFNANYNQDGLANPLFAANYRFMTQSEGMFNLDFGAVTRVNIMDAETGYGSTVDDSEDGNFSGAIYTGLTDPRTSLELNARIGKKWNEANEWQLAAGFVYFNDGESEQLINDEELELDSSMNLFLRASYQYRPVETFMMLVSLQGTQVGEVDYKSGGTTSTADSHLDWDLDFVAKYLFTDNFIGKFNYSMGINPDFDIEDTEVDERRENSFGLGVEFLF